MAVTKNLMVRAGADFSAITTQSKKASASMKSMANAANSAASMMKKAFAAVGALVSIGAIISAAKDAAAAYDQQAEAEAKLAQVMYNTMGATAQEVQAIKELTAAQQELGVIGDEVQLAGAQELATYLSKTESLKQLIPVMNDMIAQQYGYNATQEQAASIATMLGKVMEGQTGALSRYGYYFDEAQQKILKYGTEAQRVATLAEIVEGSVGGMNAALAKTPTGRMKQLSNTMADIKESFGKAVRTLGTVFLPILNKVATILADVATLANKVAQAIANIFGKESSGKSYAYGAAQDTAGAVNDVADSYDNAANKTKKAAAAQKKAAQQLKQSLSSADIDILHTLAEKKKDEDDTGSGSGDDDDDYTEPDTGGGGGSGIQEMPEEAAESAGWLEEILQKLKDLWDELDFEPLKKAWEGLKEALKPLVDLIKEGLAWCWEHVLKPLAHWTIEKLAPELINLLAAAFRVLTAVLEKLKPVFAWLWENILQPLAKWTGELFIFALQEITDLLNDLADLINGKISFREFISQLDLFQKGILAVGAALAGIKIASWVTGAITALGKLKATIEGIIATLTGAKAAAAGVGTAAAGAGNAVGTNLLPAAKGTATALGSFATQGLLGAGALVAIKSTAESVLNPLNDYDDLIWDSSASSDDLRAAVEELDKSLAQQVMTYDSANPIQRLFLNLSKDIIPTQTKLEQAVTAYYQALAREGKQVDENTRLTLKSTESLKFNGEAYLRTGKDAESAGNTVERSWLGVSSALQKHGETIKSSISSAWESIKQKSSELAQHLKSAWDAIKSCAASAADAAKEKFASAWASVKSNAIGAWGDIKAAFSIAGSWAKGVGDAIANGISNALQALVQKVQQIAQQIKQAIESIKSAVSNAQSSVSNTLNNIKTSASNVISGIGSKISGAWNSLTSGFSGGISYPHLAAGAVIPPNREFAAVLGDQTSGYNIETPEGLLRQIFREEAAYSNDTTVDLLKDILRAVRSGQTIEVDRHAFARTVRQASAY